MENSQTTLNNPVTAPTTLLDKCAEVRSLMLAWENKVINLMQCSELEGDPTPSENKGEAKANIMLSYRHMEDARMRIGKVIQAMSGGKSIYDK